MKNGVHEQHSAPGEGIVLEKMNGVPASGSEIAAPNGNPETVDKLEDDGIVDPSTIAVPDRPFAHAETNGVTASKGEDKTETIGWIKASQIAQKAGLNIRSYPWLLDRSPTALDGMHH